MEPRDVLSTENLTSVALPVAAAALGSVATSSGTSSAWYRSLDKPSIQPPGAVFPVVWTGLYSATAVASALAQRQTTAAQAARFRRKLLVNMALNAGWSWSFFGARRIVPSVAVAAALAASTVDLTRSAATVSKPAGALLAPYAAWTSFATVLTAAIWRRNPGRP